MGEVTVSVAGRAYQLICDDGEEDRLQSLAARVDAEAKPFQSPGAGISEARLLLMSALMLADKLDEAEVAMKSGAPAPVQTAPAGAEPSASQIGMFAEEEAAQAAAAIDAATDRIEELWPGGAKSGSRAPRNRKSSTASEAERDLLAWLSKPDVAPSADKAPGEVGAAEADEASDTPPEGAATAEDATPPADAANAEPAEEDAAPASTVDLDEQIAIRRARRAERRARLARLAKEESGEA